MPSSFTSSFASGLHFQVAFKTIVRKASKRWQTHFKLQSVVQGVFSTLFRLTSLQLLLFGCRASGKLRELSRALELFCPAKSGGVHRLRHLTTQ
ncbi:hypothetical protein N7449_012309 [Penicillium cf. viridicatum]|uniref:Uncharacterized protein n=1 Tax=Penicillium cf. viridicatum TaxID=2972119 RepID=A0A9W9IQL2_9EURO|nr:hypothetical protein N7449_012309 [Penicillium cf. viridicatum]